MNVGIYGLAADCPPVCTLCMAVHAAFGSKPRVCALLSVAACLLRPVAAAWQFCFVCLVLWHLVARLGAKLLANCIVYFAYVCRLCEAGPFSHWQHC